MASEVLLTLFLISLISCSFGQMDLWIDCCPDCSHSTQKPQDLCQARGCWWNPKSVPNAPWCQFANSNDPSLMAGYDVSSTGQKSDSLSVTIKRRPTASLFGEDYQEAVASFEPVDDEILKITITDKDQTARVPKYPDIKANLLNSTGKAKADAALDIVLEDSPFGFAIVRRSSGIALIDSRRIPGFTFAKQYLQLSTRVPTKYVYGLGDSTHSQLNHDFNWKNWGLFAKDQPPGLGDMPLYASYPLYLCIDDDQGNAHGIFFHDTHAYNVALQPDSANPDGGIITWRFIGGPYEIYVLPGPTVDDVMRQYTNIVGKPQLPPYWSLGFQLCRYGYTSTQDVERIFDRNRAADIPQDVQMIDIDYMLQHMDYTTDPVAFAGLSDFIQKVHEQNMRIVLIVDPAIADKPSIDYDPLKEGLQANVFVKDSRTGQSLEGAVWPGTTYFPDFTHPNATPWWTTSVKNFYQNQNIQFDGLWIDMNEPSCFVTGSTTGCANNKLNNPPYNPLIYNDMNQQTICLDSDHYDGKHYELHNVYGHTEGVATYKALQSLFPGKRPFLLSRSTFPGSGKYVNHWTGDNFSLWPHMQLSIVAIIEYNVYGIPFVGADICGFNGDTNEEMCVRWHQLGAFYPFSRNHNTNDSPIEQDPAAWSSTAQSIIRHYLQIRYTLLPYLYTLLHQAHTDGTPVARAVFFDYAKDKAAREINDQFMLGPGLMIAPVIWQGVIKRQVYFPQGRWYSLENYLEVAYSTGGRWLDEDVPLDFIAVYIRGGFILPKQDPAVNTVLSRKSPFTIAVGLDENSQAKGTLYWDDGETEEAAYSLVEFNAYQNTNQTGGIHVKMTSTSFNIEPPLNTVVVYGMQSNPKTVTVDGVQISADQVVYDAKTKLLTLNNLAVQLNANHEIAWQF